MDQRDFEIYLECLRRVVGFPTLFTRPDQIEMAMAWCETFFASNLRDYRSYRDRNSNLIVCPLNLDPDQDVIYLSAHMDTVDADASEWDKPFLPFSLYEDAQQMVARGVSDCKAGIAFELFLARLAGMGKMKLSNLIFTITFKEEGPGMKSACAIGENFGHALPVSRQDTFFIVLENTMTVANPSIFSFYTAERGNFVIRVSDKIDRLQRILDHLAHWNPVSIRPDLEGPGSDCRIATQKGGHVCSVPRGQNILTRIIEQARANDLVWAGDESNFSVVPPKIYTGRSERPATHHLVISNRSFDTIEDVHAQLKGITYTEVKDFSISQGMNFDDVFSSHRLSRILKASQVPGLNICQTYNIGASDATIVTRCMAPEFKKRFYPIVMGPGTRSQRDKIPPRLTHGKNETFDKKSGEAGVEFLLSVLTALSCVDSKQWDEDSRGVKTPSHLRF
ncbi:M20/M25/M40 family metallo-hydrolase [Desulforapulum autotrophicum]|nr:M20/M25/M40 family metallo-hydrolase [Desulforapulum autotrophicum]